MRCNPKKVGQDFGQWRNRILCGTVRPVMKSRIAAVVCMTLALGSLVACNKAGSTSAAVELPNGDACGDAYFWATSDSNDVAVTVTIDAQDRSRQDATTVRFTLPDPSVEVEVLGGRDLSRNFCTDVIDSTSEPQDRQMVTGGKGTITLEIGRASCRERV